MQPNRFAFLLLTACILGCSVAANFELLSHHVEDRDFKAGPFIKIELTPQQIESIQVRTNLTSAEVQKFFKESLGEVENLAALAGYHYWIDFSAAGISMDEGHVFVRHWTGDELDQYGRYGTLFNRILWNNSWSDCMTWIVEVAYDLIAEAHRRGVGEIIIKDSKSASMELCIDL